MKSANGRRLLSLAAAFAVVAAMLGGTWAAYVKFDQATGRAQGNGALALANLVESFEDKSNWKVTDPPLKKEIRVENLGGTSQFGSDDYSDIYTRISLKEYMDVSPMTYSYFAEEGQDAPSLFLIQRTDGLFVRFDGSLDPADENDLDTIKGDALWDKVADDGAASAYVQALTKGDFVLASSVEDKLTGVSYWYVRTGAKSPNGRYGRVLPVARVASQSYTVDETPLIDHELIAGKDYGHYDADHETGAAIECGFTEHSWGEGLSDAFRAYVSWQLDADTILYSDWIEAGGKSVKKWILDDRAGADAWAYWGAAVPPGEGTKNLLRGVKLEQQPDGDFLYVVHADMQAVDYAGLDAWEGDNDNIVAALRGAAQADYIEVGGVPVIQVANMPFDPEGLTFTLVSGGTRTDLTGLVSFTPNPIPMGTAIVYATSIFDENHIGEISLVNGMMDPGSPYWPNDPQPDDLGVPVARVGRVLKAVDAKDTSDWLEIATITILGTRYSLILRVDEIGTGKAAAAYSGSDQQAAINSFMKSTGKLAADSPIRSNSIKNTAMDCPGVHGSIDGGTISQPTPFNYNNGLAADDIAFALNYAEASQFCSWGSNVKAQYSYGLLGAPGPSYWLRTPDGSNVAFVDGTSTPNAGALASVNPSGNNKPYRPAIWVDSKLFGDQMAPVIVVA